MGRPTSHCCRATHITIDGCDFRIVSPTSTVNETHILTASSEADKAEWVELLQSSIDALMKKKPLYKSAWECSTSGESLMLTFLDRSTRQDGSGIPEEGEHVLG